SRSGKRAMQRLPLANREEEKAFFAGMVAGTADERILLLEAGGGMGKTTLMAEFVRHCRAENVACVPVNLKGDPGLHEVLARLCDGLGWDAFPAFAACVEELGREGRRAADLARYEHVHQKTYDWKAIRDLMLDAFKADDLDEFCFYRDSLKPARDHFPATDANLRSMVKALLEFCQQRPSLIDELLEGLREERFEKYMAYYARIYGVEAEAPPQPEAGRAAGAGIGRTEIRDALRAADEGDRTARRGALTRALFEDLRDRPGRMAILFDTCEQAGPETGAWLAETFLTYANRAQNLVVVIAGRQVPEMRLEWEACCQNHRLCELREPGLWQAYADEIGATLPSADWIAAFCDLFDGHPLKMMEALARYMPGGRGR
ncbi:MAG: hypothetical protein ACK2UU_18285, partial [Anaerolineae bacterium]